MRCAEILTAEVLRRSLSISIIGIPKTIDNDLHLIQKTFGFDTAISESVRVLQCAHAEAKGAFNGIGLVKIMGRQSGHIACGSALAQNDVNFLLIPEVPFHLDGPKGLLQFDSEPPCQSAGTPSFSSPRAPGQGSHEEKGPVAGKGCVGECPALGYRRISEGCHRAYFQVRRDGCQH